MKFIHKILVFILAVSLVVGCQSPVTGTPPVANPSGPATAIPSSPAGNPASAASLPDPAKNLAGLSAYQAALRLSFNGTQAGKPSQWSQSYALGVDRGSNTRLLIYQETGLDAVAAVYPAFSGYSDGVDYYRGTPADACTGNFARENFDMANLPEPAGLLPKLNALVPSGELEMVNGLPATPYDIDSASINGIASAKADGRVWMDASGTVVKYTLEISGGNDFFDKDTVGTIAWEYELSQPAAGVSLLPADCPLPLPGVPLPGDAKSILKFPGYTRFETGMDLRAAAEFYLDALSSAGFALAREAQVGLSAASFAFTREGQTVAVLIETRGATRVTVTRKAPQEAASAVAKPSPTPNQVATQVAGSPQMRVIKALTILNGENDQPSAFPSYHLEYAARLPAWDSAQSTLVLNEGGLAADVQGKNVHFISTAQKGGRTITTDVFLIDGQEYEVTNGAPTPGLGLASLTWTLWPLDVVMVLTVSSLKTTPTGTETIEGRPAEVYRVSGNVSDDPTGMIAGLGQPISQSDGTVWVDRETGALLKLQIDYETEVKDGSGTVKGRSPGSLQINVTQIGRVSVEMK